MSDAKDSARYRWLRENFTADYHRSTCDYWVIKGEQKTPDEFFGEPAQELTLDAAIDAAIATEAEAIG